MIFGQGAIRCHPYVLKEMELAQREDKDQAAREFDALLVKHIGFAVGNAASSFLLSLSCGHLGNAPGDRISRPYFRALNRLAASFALLADFSMMLLGGELKRKERLSARLGDVLSYLYLGSAALKRYHDLGNPDYLHPLLRWAMEENLGKAEAALEDLLNNFPSRFFGCALKVLVLPFGRRHKGRATNWTPRSRKSSAVRTTTRRCRRSSPARSCRRTRRTRSVPSPTPSTRYAKAPRWRKPCTRRSRKAGSSRKRAEPDRCRRRRRRAERRAGASPAPGRSGTAQGDRRRRLRQGGTATGRRQDPLTLRGKATVATDKGAFRRLCRLHPPKPGRLARIDGHI